MIGEMRCLFLSCYKNGIIPVCSIGPSYLFTLGLFVFVLLCLAYLLFMLYIVKDKHPRLAGSSACLIALNLAVLLHGILGDPGIKPKIYQNYAKRHLEKEGGDA